MLKKNAIAVVLGAMFAVPAIADDTASEAVIYQYDQAGATASINQVLNEGLPQAAAIIQSDSKDGVDDASDSLNYAAVIQGVIETGDGGVSVDSTGLAATNAGTDILSGITGANDFLDPVLVQPDDNFTGATPYTYELLGQASNNYGIILQDSQSESQAIIVQSTSDIADSIIPNQNSLLSDSGIPANDSATYVAPTADGVVASTFYDAVLDTEVLATFSGGELLVSGLTDVTVGDGLFAEPSTSEGNLAFIRQGAHLEFSNLNAGTGDIDVDDDFDGSDVALNLAAIIQSATNSYAQIGQQGQRNSSAILQNDGSSAVGNNAAESFQYTGDEGAPSDEFSLIAQVGGFNVAQTYQAGSFNTSYVYQNGDGNVSVVDQSGLLDGATQAVAFVYQSNAGEGADINTGNYASVYQHLVP